MRKLVWLVRGREELAWEHTSHLMALIFNIHRSEKTQPREPRDFNPTMQQDRRSTEEANADAMEIIEREAAKLGKQ